MILSDIKSRKSRVEAFRKGEIFKNVTKLTGKHLCLGLFTVNLHAGDFYFVEYLCTTTTVSHSPFRLPACLFPYSVQILL